MQQSLSFPVSAETPSKEVSFSHCIQGKGIINFFKTFLFVLLQINLLSLKKLKSKQTDFQVEQIEVPRFINQ